MVEKKRRRKRKGKKKKCEKKVRGRGTLKKKVNRQEGNK
jgi:hypothetical protein